MSHWQVFLTIEDYYKDFWKLRYWDGEGRYSIIHMDEYAHMLLTEEIVFDITLPFLPKRQKLEAE